MISRSRTVIFKCEDKERRVPLEFCEQRFDEYVQSLVDPDLEQCEVSGDDAIIFLKQATFEKFLIMEDLFKFDEYNEYENMHDENLLLEFMNHAISLGYIGNMKMLVFGLYNTALGKDKKKFRVLLERHEWLKRLFIEAVEEDVDSIYKFGERFNSKGYYPAARDGRLFVWNFGELIGLNKDFFDGAHASFGVIIIRSSSSGTEGGSHPGNVSHVVFGDRIERIPERYLRLKFDNIYLPSWKHDGGNPQEAVMNLQFPSGTEVKRLALGMCSDAADPNNMITPQYSNLNVRVLKIANLKNVFRLENLDISEVEYLALILCTGFRARNGYFKNLKILDIIKCQDVDFSEVDIPSLEDFTTYGCIWTGLKIPKDAGNLRRLFLGKCMKGKSFEVNDFSIGYDLSKLNTLHIDAQYCINNNETIYESKLQKLKLIQRDFYEVTFPRGLLGMSRKPCFRILDLKRLDTSRIKDLYLKVYDKPLYLKDFPSLKSISVLYCKGPIYVSSALMEKGIDNIDGYHSHFIFERPMGSNRAKVKVLELENCEVKGLEAWDLSDVIHDVL